MSLSVRGVTRFACLPLLGTAAHDLELLPKLMKPPCMLIAWIESHDPDVKEVRFTHLFLLQRNLCLRLSVFFEPFILFVLPCSLFSPPLLNGHYTNLNLTQTEQIYACYSDLTRIFFFFFGVLLSRQVATNVECAKLVSRRTNKPTLTKNKQTKNTTCAV